jgi:hypothetical protein
MKILGQPFFIFPQFLTFKISSQIFMICNPSPECLNEKTHHQIKKTLILVLMTGGDD